MTLAAGGTAAATHLSAADVPPSSSSSPFGAGMTLAAGGTAAAMHLSAADVPWEGRAWSLAGQLFQDGRLDVPRQFAVPGVDRQSWIDGQVRDRKCVPQYVIYSLLSDPVDKVGAKYFVDMTS